MITEAINEIALTRLQAYFHWVQCWMLKGVQICSFSFFLSPSDLNFAVQHIRSLTKSYQIVEHCTYNHLFHLFNASPSYLSTLPYLLIKRSNFYLTITASKTNSLLISMQKLLWIQKNEFLKRIRKKKMNI